MKDKLKDFICEHKDEFDVYEPRQELWQEICQEMPPIDEKQKAKVISINFGKRASFKADYVFMRVAVAVLLLIGCGFILFYMKEKAVVRATNTIAATQPATIKSIAPELVEVETYYTSQISEKKKQLSDYDLKVLGLDESMQIDYELARLDSTYQQLKKELYTTPNTDKVVSAMIQNLQIRIEVLNRQLEVLQKIDKLENVIDSEVKENETANV
ncbi:hypothetical protein ACFSKU_04305 [Pontibacter silvestris]|uniref:Anti-sigma factor n=1 Tax=Pontibacter silvestris TaxID=2305183 RepID=A0ABW4WTK1_9BACT|nr:hypothetical protein [Pontibacter silvestris]MCC9137198.1 hypothetical protein [Pontibacter silvestris]